MHTQKNYIAQEHQHVSPAFNLFILGRICKCQISIARDTEPLLLHSP